MSFIESADDVERALREATKKLAAFEEDVSSERAWERLREESPGHPVILLRGLFILLGFLATTVGALLLALPLAYPSLDRETQRQIPIEVIRSIEAAVGFPLPAVFLAIGFLLLFGFIMLGLAAVSIGRDAAMLDWEAKEHAELADAVKRLTQQKNAMARNSATPAPRGRGASPGGGALVDFEGGGGGAGPLVDFTGGGGASAPAPRGGSGYGPSSGGATGGFGGATQGSGGAVRGGGGGFGTATGGGGSGGGFGAATGGGGFGGPPGGGDPDMLVSFEKGAAMPAAERPTAPSPAMTRGAPASRGAAVAAGSALGGDFEAKRATVIPNWGPCEPWLEDALRRSESLANTFPIQARLEFNKEADLPFLLSLERATPAMAVRAMMAYVEFLANIPTPRKARVDLGAASVDRSFYRNVMSAVEPYFPDSCELVKGEHDVELNFMQPDARWGNYPYLPVA